VLPRSPDFAIARGKDKNGSIDRIGKVGRCRLCVVFALYFICRLTTQLCKFSDVAQRLEIALVNLNVNISGITVA